MQTRPRIAVLVSMIAATLLVAGCSSSPSNDSPLPDGAGLVKDADQTTRQQQSVHLVLTVAGEIPSLPISSLEGDLTNVPSVAAQGKASIPSYQLKDIPFVVADGTLYAGLSTGGTLTPFGKAADLYDVGAILSPSLGLANVLANFSDAKAEGRETISDVATVKISGKVTGEAVNGIAPQIGASGDVPATVWVREDGDHALVQAKLDVSSGNSVQMTLTDWGKPVTVNTPPAR